MLVLCVQQSDSFIRIHLSIVFKFFSHKGYYRILNRDLCAIEKVLVGSLFYIW